MSENEYVKPPVWFWILSAVLLVWNIAGLVAFFMQVTMSPEDLAALPEAERQLMENMPDWATIAFAAAVFAGTLGCVSLLLRKVYAYHLFVVSFIGVLLQMFHSFFLANAYEVYGAEGTIGPAVVMVISIFLIWFARLSRSKGWIHG